MESILTVVTGIARVVALLGGVLAAVFVAWAGIQWMTAAGDPQKMSQARMSLIGSVVGLIIVGIAFLIPSVISELVIEPAGGIAVQVELGTDCDGVLRRLLVVNRTASTYQHMNFLITQVEAGRDECGSSLWSPRVHSGTTNPLLTTGCYTGSVGPVEGSWRLGGRWSGWAVCKCYRCPPEFRPGQQHNNIIVHWKPDRRPSDSTDCWLYSSTFDTWTSGGGG